MEMELRLLKVKELKQKLQLQQNMFTYMNSQSEGAVKTSFIIPEETARACRLFTEGEFIKNCIEKVCDVVCPDKKQAFANIRLSRNTMARRVDELGTDLQIQLKEKDNELIAYSLAIDESADRTDTAQLLILIRGVDSQLSITEELLDIRVIHGTTSGQGLFSYVEQCINDTDWQWNKHALPLTTDGAMCGEVRSLVRKKSVSDTVSIPFPTKVYADKLNTLTVEFIRRFADFETKKINLDLFANPFAVDADAAPEHLQLELIELQCSTHLKTQYEKVGAAKFAFKVVIAKNINLVQMSTISGKS
ncbi:hypothetical protein M9458_052140 [Cirrhinus mrigala]|uniref:DUF4371 domain-containing protein n=1 Tax=Cirrhinus mrigala TaxID=683832 RepID=A0ABD0MQV4_CIRMR